MATKKALVIAAECYSSNLGDGIIAETMPFIFKKVSPSLPIRLLDISGQESWTVKELNDNKRLQNKLYKRARWLLGGQLFNLCTWYSIKKGLYSQRWHDSLSNASRLVIGGGQLLMDNELDFPLKINQLVHSAHSLELEIHFSACGVGTNRAWSKLGTRWLLNALERAKTITVRDPISQEKLHRMRPTLDSSVTFDPGIFISEVHKTSLSQTKRTLVGLGIIDVAKINAYNPNRRPLSLEEMIDFWLALCVYLHHKGMACEIFTNGSIPDQRFAAQLAQAAEEKLSFACPLAKRPLSPRELALGISRYRAIVASRLHANIIASSYRIPTVGLIWDEKVKSFFQQTDRQDFALSIDEWHPEEVYRRLVLALERGIEQEELKHWQDSALQNAKIILEKMNH